MPQFNTTHTREELEGKCGIYKITLRGTPRVYIGQSKDVWKRMRQHINDSIGKYKGCRKTKISYALAKHGIEAFNFSVITYCDPGNLNGLEEHFIMMFNAATNGFNIQTQALLDYKPQGCTDETREKLSVANMGKKRSLETKARMRESALRKPPRTAESKAKQGAALRGRKQSEEQKEKARQFLLGKKLPPEWRANLKRGAQSRALAIEQFDKGGNFIARHPSCSEAAIAVNGHVGNLVSALKGRLKSHRGFIWKYAPALAN